MKKQKIAVILCDGMADYPDENGNTPMSMAYKPKIDKLAACAEVGLCKTVPDDMKPGSDVANISVIGFDPRVAYTGRSPLEAVSMGIALGDNDVTYRCNLVTLSDDEPYENKTMLDYSAGEITTAEARELIVFLAQNISGLELTAGVSYRHCLVRRSGRAGAVLTPPHDISDRKITEYLPKGEYAEQLNELMRQSYDLLKNHPINQRRIAEGKNPANSVWLWGEGTKPNLENFTAKYGLHGAMISAVDLLKGIAIGAGMDSIDVDGATGTLSTNWEGKAKAAADALSEHDFVYVHLEAPDECGHQGDKEGKTKAIELIDKHIVAAVLSRLNQIGQPYAVVVIPDHATPVTLKTHTSDPVPYLIYRSDAPQKGTAVFTENAAAKTGNTLAYGFDLLPHILNNT